MCVDRRRHDTSPVDRPQVPIHHLLDSAQTYACTHTSIDLQILSIYAKHFIPIERHTAANTTAQHRIIMTANYTAACANANESVYNESLRSLLRTFTL